LALFYFFNQQLTFKNIEVPNNLDCASDKDSKSLQIVVFGQLGKEIEACKDVHFGRHFSKTNKMAI